MPGDTRIKGRNVAIDYAATEAFFDHRGRQDYRNALSATMYQDDNPALVEQRDLAEKALVAPRLDLGRRPRILDIGCGIGRWGWFLADNRAGIDYLGIDFSSSLIDRARSESAARGHDALHFQVMSASAIDPTALQRPAPFDLILVSGLLIYMNDDDVTHVLRSAAALCAAGGGIYLREPVALGERLTLDRFDSTELASEYSAIYRTRSELDTAITASLPTPTFAIEHSGFLFPDALERRGAETRQFHTILRKAG